MPRAELTKLQNERLRAVVKRVYENVPFYKKKFDEMGLKPEDICGIEDLTKLPFTNKQDLRDNYPFDLFAVPMDEVVRIHASSGTTGKQTVVGYTKHDLDIWGEVMARTLGAGGVTKKDIGHISYGYGLFTGGMGGNLGSETVGCATIPASTGNTRRQVTILQDFKPTFILATPSYALTIAEYLAENNIDPASLSLKAGFFGAEPWTEEMRREIENRFQIKAYDIYGLSEAIGPGVAYECECQHGLHVNEDHFLIEIIDPDTGEQLPDGTEGEIVFTCMICGGSKASSTLASAVTARKTVFARFRASTSRTTPQTELFRIAVTPLRLRIPERFVGGIFSEQRLVRRGHGPAVFKK